MKIAEACCYMPEYAGTFIANMTALKDWIVAHNRGDEVIFIFPELDRTRSWCQELQKTCRVMFCHTRESNIINRTFYRICRDEQIDVLHLHFYDIRSAMLVKPLTRTKVIYHMHRSMPVMGMKRKILNRIKNAICMPTLDKVLCCSDGVLASVLACGYPRKKCAVVTNRINFSRFDKITDPDPFSATAKANNLIIFGSYFEIKGIDLALKAIEPIAAKYNIILHIFSNWPEKTKSEVEGVMGKRCDWVHMHHTTEHIADYYSAATLFLTPSRTEGFCYANIEALYCGCPIIKTNLPAMIYNIENEEEITFDGSIENLRERIEHFLTMPKEELEGKLTQWRQEAVDKYSIERWCEEIYDQYKNLTQTNAD